jgi:hypothetical protein
MGKVMDKVKMQVPKETHFGPFRPLGRIEPGVE